MNPDSKLDDLVASFSADARRALQEAFRRGGEQMRANILRAASGDVGPSPTPMGPATQHHTEIEHASEVAKRAPRGLTRQVVNMILDEYPNLTTVEVQERAVDLDDRVSAKTVYNELNRERGKFYLEHLGRWRLIRPVLDNKPASEITLEDLTT